MRTYHCIAKLEDGREFNVTFDETDLEAAKIEAVRLAKERFPEGVRKVTNGGEFPHHVPNGRERRPCVM